VGSDGFSEACSKAKVALGYGTDKEPCYTSWPRLVNTMVCGCFFLTRWFPKIDRIFKNRTHLVWFKSIDEAVELTKYYITHDEKREKIAQAGRQEVLAKHTWDHRIARMLEYAGFR
jgi:spore maturation protein CgeB